MSGAASTLRNININFAAATRGGCGVTHPRGSGDLRQRRHSSPIRPLPPVAAPWPTRGVGGPHQQQLLTNLAQHNRQRARR